MASLTPSKKERDIYKQELRQMLVQSVTIELATIPLYLYAMYSIKQDNGGAGTKARARISVVVLQEMLHMALAGNVLTAIDCGPNLYSETHIPTFGGEDDTILFSRIPLQLQSCNKDNLECFLKIEAPYEPPPQYSSDEEDDESIGAKYERHLDKFNSIGEFYEALGKKIAVADKYIDWKNADKQFIGADFFNDNMVRVVDQASAQKALEVIVGQGEGSVGIEDAHYQMFLALYRRRKEWTCWPVVVNPKTEMYKGDEFLYNLSSCFDAIYCYLLITIERTWYTSEAVQRRLLLRNNHAIMIDIMAPLAELFVTQPWGTEGKTAAPAFQYYDLHSNDDVDEKARKLFEAMVSHITAAIKAAPNDAAKQTLSAIQFSTGSVTWPFK